METSKYRFWPLFLTRTVLLERRVPNTSPAERNLKTDLLSIIHDTNQVLHLSPLVYSVVPDPKMPEWFTISEMLPLFGGRLESSTTFRCRWTCVPDGGDGDVKAGAGTWMRSEMRVRDSEEGDGSVVFAEKLQVQNMNETAITFATILAALLAFVAWFKMRSSDPYGLFHLTLNKLPGEDPKAPPRTEWLNMGYWKDTNIFPEACRALALKMISAANLVDKGRVLDVGHGTGESLLLLLSEPSLPRPSYLAGITSLAAHHQRSLQRVHKHQEISRLSDTKISLSEGNAVYDGRLPEHPLSPSSEESFDSILALDCAYHFETRKLFLEQSFAKLTPGGSIALADVCFSSSSLKTRWTRFTTSVLRMMPARNLISDGDYISQMEDMGYVDVRLEDISAGVFPGFAEFLKSRKWGWWVFGKVIEWYYSAGAQFVIVSGKKPSL